MWEVIVCFGKLFWIGIFNRISLLYLFNEWILWVFVNFVRDMI